MDGREFGRASHHTRVEAWECDFNGHWNTRFYMRAFQNAYEAIVMLDTAELVWAQPLVRRHVRFHQELYSGDPVAIRSAIVETGDWEGAIAHALFSNGVLSATALDLPGHDSNELPLAPAESLSRFLPYGLRDPFDMLEPKLSNGRTTLVGIVQPYQFDHEGTMLFDEIIRYISQSAHEHTVTLGFSPAFTAETNIGRMVVELRTQRHGSPKPGESLRAQSCLTSVKEKSFGARYHLETQAGTPIATVDLCYVAVDMKSRGATTVPGFLRSALA